MERLAAPQTHLSLKAMIKEVDEDQDGKLSFREVNKKETETINKKHTITVVVTFSQMLCN